MLSNKVSIKDLFSTNPGQLLGSKYDSGGNLPDSCSQLPFSQDSQDFMSSQQFSTTHSQPCESPGRRFYQRYASKGPLFNKDVSQAKGQMTMTKSSYQQQLQNNKTRARERDERDLLNSVMLTVRESAAEVKIAASAVRDVVQQGNGVTEKQLTQHLQQIETGLNRHSDAMLKALQLRDGVKEQMAQMQQELAAKTSHVAELEKQLDRLQQTQHQQIMDQLQQTYQDTAQHVSGQLQQMYERHQRQLLKQASEHQEHHHAVTQQTDRCHKQLSHQQQAAVEEIKKKMDEDFGSYNEQQEMRYRHCLNEMQARMQQIQEQQKAQIRVFLQQQVACKAGASEQMQAEMDQRQTKQLQEMQTKHKQELNHFVQQQMESMRQQQEQQVQSVIEGLWQSEKDKARQDAQQQSHTAETSHPRYESELVNLKNRYQKEVEEIRAKQRHQSQYCTSDADSLILSPFQPPKPSDTSSFGWVGAPDDLTHHRSRDLVTSNLTASHYMSSSRHISDPDATSTNPTTTKSTASTRAWSSARGCDITSPSTLPCHTTLSLTTNQPFVSPLLAARNWTSRNLFGKSNPSPVATVLPQRQVPDRNTSSSSGKTSQRSASEDDSPRVKKRKQTRKKSMDGRKKASGKSDNRQNNSNNQNGECKTKQFTRSQAVATANASTDPSETNTRQAESVTVYTYNTKTSTKIYNFSDDPPMAAVSGYHMRNKAHCNEDPKPIEDTQPDRWQSACRINPLVHSVHAAKPFMSRTFKEETPDQSLTVGDSEASQDYDNDYSDSSSSSSPGMTITAEVFIKRRIKNERKTPPENKRDIQNAVKGCIRSFNYLAGNDGGELDNFLASPKLACCTSTVETTRKLRSRTIKKLSSN